MSELIGLNAIICVLLSYQEFGYHKSIWRKFFYIFASIMKKTNQFLFHVEILGQVDQYFYLCILLNKNFGYIVSFEMTIRLARKA